MLGIVVVDVGVVDVVVVAEEDMFDMLGQAKSRLLCTIIIISIIIILILIIIFRGGFIIKFHNLDRYFKFCCFVYTTIHTTKRPFT
jgi:hypothetical protein